ncbi:MULTISPECIES: peptidoglycan recognition protein family protein [Protofrankia]|uniref:N-acetylmuramoyl-L-alanine amidase family 2 n=1 Tax=Candidatus Protofrankia datiscae TaxID=2716812 RepID=F8B687_9ACTN|nr:MULTISPECIES: N-acetylmuramoyl-L-alanine amidase [Protofrankia]AEH08057.1 N-acetylmuramoyl-L-alanine amidase family 2 [Candidatus Protofrankia datiscae]
MAHIVQGFQYRPVRNTAGDTIRPIGLVLHVAQGNGSQFNWFNDPRSQVSSNLWAGKAGQREQYVPSDVRAWAQLAGNGTYNSIETEGFDTEALTPEQIESVAVAYADGVHAFGWALAVTDTPGQSGLITHGAGNLAWGNHPGCPGAIRAGQRQQIVVRAAQIVGGSASPTQPKVVALQHAVHVAADGVWGPATDAALAAVRANQHTRAEQAAVGATVDGAWGPRSQAAYVATVRTIQSILEVGVDGVWGPVTDRAFVAARNSYFTG